MLDISKTCKRLIMADIAVSLIIYGVGVAFLLIFSDFFSTYTALSTEPISFTIGMVVGTVFTVLKCLFMERSLNKIVDMPQENAINYTRLQYTIRYFLNIAVIVAAIFIKGIDVLGIVLAIVALKPAAYIAAKLEDRDRLAA